MKRIKTLMIVLATLPGITIATMIPAQSIAAPYFMNWTPIWKRLAEILLDALKIYLDKAIERGYPRVGMPASQIATVLDSEENIKMAAANGFVFDGQSLTLSQDILIYVKDDVGVALQKGDYELDGKGNFNLNLIKVLKPVPSPTFPLPDGGEN